MCLVTGSDDQGIATAVVFEVTPAAASGHLGVIGCDLMAEVGLGLKGLS
jgi:hypothetical protein